MAEDILPNTSGKLDYPLNFNDKKIIEGTDFSELHATRFTGKVPDPITSTIASSATPSINTDATDFFSITALAVAITSFTTNLSGNPQAGRRLIIRIKDDGTARAITWGASFASRGETLPTTTVLGKYMYCGFLWNEVALVWDLIALENEA